MTPSWKSKPVSGLAVKRPREAKMSESDAEIELSMGGGKSAASTKKPKLDEAKPPTSDEQMFASKIEGLPTPVPACVKTAAGLETKLGKWSGKWDDPGQGAVMTELANLVGAHGHTSEVSSPRQDLQDMFTAPFIRGFRTDRIRQDMFDNSVSGDLSDDGSGGEGGSGGASSHISNKSDKNMGDFVDEDSADEAEVKKDK